jgi:hypothetical protein
MKQRCKNKTLSIFAALLHLKSEKFHHHTGIGIFASLLS